METNTEITKLTNVLRRIARAARHSAWSRDADSARFCAVQYNKVRARLGELEPAIATLFTALPESASPEVTRIAAYELAAYFEDEAPAVAAVGIGFTRRGCGGRRAWAGRVKLDSCW